MAVVTVLSESEVTDVDATMMDSAVWVSPSDLEQVLGWALRPEGLCRSGLCVPIPDRASITDGEMVDLVALAGLVGSASVIDSDHSVVAVSVAAQRRQDGLLGRRAPDFTLPDLDGQSHSLSEFDGKRRLLVAFATW